MKRFGVTSLIGFGAVALSMATVGMIQPVSAVSERTSHAQPQKVFVCKYVAKPSVAERIKAGKNPISVSVNAIPDYHGVGSYFADGQFLSYVLEIDNGQTPPDVSKCQKAVDDTPPTPGNVLSTSTTRPAEIAATGTSDILWIVGGVASVLTYLVALVARRSI